MEPALVILLIFGKTEKKDAYEHLVKIGDYKGGMNGAGEQPEQ